MSVQQLFVLCCFHGATCFRSLTKLNRRGNTGVRFSGIPQLESSGHAPAGWQFNPDEWWVEPGGYTAFRSHSNSNLLIHPAWGRWVEEHGLIMDPPTPLQEGRYQLSWLNRRPGATPTVVLTVSGDNWSCVTPHHTDALC